MSDTDRAYCYFRTRYAAERFRARLASSFRTTEPYTTDTPYQGRPVVVEVTEHDGSTMGTRTFATLLSIVNLYDGLVSDIPESRPESRATSRPGGAPFSGPLPEGVVDETG